jgi:hypothetical protein
MCVVVYIAGTKNEAASKLKWVFAQSMLAMSRGFCSLPGDAVVFTQHVRQRSLLQFGGTISFALFVYQQRKSDAGVFPEMAGVIEVAQTDRHKLRALALEGLLVFAQLRDVLTAENSAVVTKKDNYRRGVGPK